MQMDDSFKNFQMPPGRGSLFEGIKDVKILDSSYNVDLSSMTAMVKLFEQFPNDKKWAVISDMLEQGSGEQAEHEKLAELLAKTHFDRIILMGPRVSEFTYPKLKAQIKDTQLEKFLEPKEVLEYLNQNIQGGEAILFKGARFLEGVIEHLLKNKDDVAKLARREKIWEQRRKKWGL
jgi:UDP-N-acetylmuramyl pentapeptide synthase